MKKNLKAIIFDLGNVIINIDPQIYESEFAKIGININHPRLIEMSHNIECGLSSFESFVDLANDISCQKLNYDTYIRAWNSILLDFPKRRIEMIQHLKSEFDIYLLSNTNTVHKEAYCKAFMNEYGFEFDSLFKIPFYSQDMGCRKPSAEIYEKMIAESGVVPQECLFIDDIAENVEGGEKAGFNVVHAVPGFDIADYFASW